MQGGCERQKPSWDVSAAQACMAECMCLLPHAHIPSLCCHTCHHESMCWPTRSLWHGWSGRLAWTWISVPVRDFETHLPYPVWMLMTLDIRDHKARITRRGSQGGHHKAGITRQGGELHPHPLRQLHMTQGASSSAEGGGRVRLRAANVALVHLPSFKV